MTTYSGGPVEAEVVRLYNLGEAPCFSGGPYVAPSLSASHYLPYPVAYDYEPTAIQRPEYVFVARCKNCRRELHLDPDTPIPPAFCGLGMTHGCGSSEWHVFKRLIKVEVEEEYVDDCVYDDNTPVTRPVGTCQVGTYYAEPEPGCITLPSITEEEVSTLREKWEQVIRHVRQNSCTPGGM